MKKHRKKRFANVCLTVMAALTFVFVCANLVSFYFFQVEQTALISAWFGCVGVEIVALISKRISDNKYNKNDENSGSEEDEEDEN